MAENAERTIETRATGMVDDRDELTGVHGRYALLNSFNFDEYAGRDVYVVLCDLDNFRMINDAYGENVGNGVLAEIGGVIRSIFGDDRVCRYGSDEFLILNAFYDEDSFLEKIHNLDKRVDAVGYNGEPLHITCSYGYTYGEVKSSDDLHEAIRLADRKMYEAKRMGKARAVGVPLSGDPLLLEGRAEVRKYKSYEMDELTGLANLIYFRGQLEHILSAQREQPDLPDGERVALVYFNIHNFKVYNERFGFEAGDELLLLVGNAIRNAFPGCLAARFSADQFMVAAAADNAEDGVREVRMAFRKKQKSSSIWLKAGIYVPTDEDTNVGLNMDRPKIACDSIRGRRDVFFCYYDDKLRAEILMHRYVLDNFERALEENWVKVFYQPIVRVATGEVCDEEALARWVDPDNGVIPPAGFISVLEEARLIHKLDLYMVRRACENIKIVVSEGSAPTPVSVNLSPLDFELCDVVSEIVKIVDEMGVARDLISVEVTESALAGNQEFLKGEIDRFRTAGFEVWMDDFGSGYSSLNTLESYDFDLVKVDMGFLRNFEQNEEARILLSHIIGMTKEMGIKTLVEGVETAEQLEFLSSIGCGRAQGYFFGMPSSLADVREATIDGAYPPLELPDRHSFYEAVGRVNLLRPDPAKAIDGHYVPGDFPAAIMRRQNGVYEYLNVSNVYRSFLRAMGVDSVYESEVRLNDKTRVEHIRVDESVEVCIRSGEWEWATYYENGKYCSLRVKCIANKEEDDMVAIIVVAINIQESALITPIR